MEAAGSSGLKFDRPMGDLVQGLGSPFFFRKLLYITGKDHGHRCYEVFLHDELKGMHSSTCHEDCTCHLKQNWLRKMETS